MVSKPKEAKSTGQKDHRKIVRYCTARCWASQFAGTNFRLDFNWIYNSRTRQQPTFCTVGGLKMKASLQYLLQDSILKADLTEITGIFCSESTPARCHAISPLTLVSHRSPAEAPDVSSDSPDSPGAAPQCCNNIYFLGSAGSISSYY